MCHLWANYDGVRLWSSGDGMTWKIGVKDRENPEGRDRLARISQASRRISESSGFDTALQEVVESGLSGHRRR